MVTARVGIVTVSRTTSDGRRLLYVALQPTRPGQGGYAHVHAIVDGLTLLGWTCDLVDPVHSERVRKRGLRARLADWRAVIDRATTALPGHDLVYVRDHPAALPVMRAARRHGIPVVLELNGGFDELALQHAALRPLRPLFAQQARARVRAADGVVCVTRGLANWAETVGGDATTTVIPNGADTKVFSPQAQTTLDLPDPYVVFIGSLSPWHGLDTLLDAARSPDWPRDMNLVVAGSGSLDRIVARAEEDLAHLTYLGSVPYEQIPGLLAGSRGGLSTQSRKAGYTAGSPVKVYEAAACGIPGVVSDFLEVAEDIRVAGAGLVFAADDAHDLARQVARLARAPHAAAEMGARARTLAVSDFDWSNRSAATHAFIAAILDKTRGSRTLDASS